MISPKSPRGRSTGPVFIALLAAAAPACAWEPYLVLDSFAHAEPVPVSDYVDDWDAPLSSGSDAITHSWLETGVRHGDWSLAYVQRYDYEIKANRAAAALYHRARNKLEFAPGERFNFELSAWHVRLQGLRASYRFGMGGFGSLEAGLSWLDAWTLTDGSLVGSATAVAARDYDYEANVDYFYSEDVLFERQTARPGGTAYSLDARWRWQPAADWQIDAQLRDVLGRVHWQDTPFTSARVTSDTKEFDEDGYVRYTPALSGRESNRDHVQRLHPRGLVAVDWQPLDHHRFGARLRLTEVRQYASLAWIYAFAGDWQLDGETLLDPFALGLRLGWRGFSIGWLADDLRADDAHVLRLQLNAAWAL